MLLTAAYNLLLKIDLFFSLNKGCVLYSKWFEAGGNMWKCSLIVRVSVVLKRTVVGIGDHEQKSSPASDDDFHSDCRNVSHFNRPQSFSELHSPGRSDYTMT